MKKLVRRRRRPTLALTQGSGLAVLEWVAIELGWEPAVIETRRDAQAVKFDTLLLPGGNDINPNWYGEMNRFSRAVDSERDRIEWKLLERAYEAGKPVLGICRGHQLLSVAYGSSLAQDVILDGLTKVGHTSAEHTLRGISPNLAAHLPDGKRQIVNSYHHQAVTEAPRGFVVTARSPDGLIESVFSPRASGGAAVLGVQFHPEFMVTADRRWLELFRWFLSGYRPAATTT